MLQRVGGWENQKEGQTINIFQQGRGEGGGEEEEEKVSIFSSLSDTNTQKNTKYNGIFLFFSIRLEKPTISPFVQSIFNYFTA